MTTLKVRFEGDGSKLKSDIKEIASLGTKAEADVAAATKQAEAEKQSVRKRSAQELLQTTKQQVDEQKRLVQQASDDDRTSARADLDALKVLLKGRTQAVRDAAAAERESAREVAAANRAVRQAEQAEERAWMQERTRMARDAVAESRKLGSSGGSTKGGSAGSDIDSSTTGQVIQLGALWSAVKKAAMVINQAAAIIDQANKKMVGDTVAANESRDGRVESLRLAGLSADDATRVARSGEAGAGRYKLADLDAAFTELGKTATTKLDPKRIERVMELAGKESLSGALAALGQGYAPEEAVKLSEGYYQASRGGTLSADQAAQGKRLSKSQGSYLKKTQDTARYLAAADMTGTDLTQVDADAVFNNQGELFDNYNNIGPADGLTRFTSLVNQAKARNEAVLLANLVDGDQTQALAAEDRRASAEQNRNDIMINGGTGIRTVLTMADMVGAGGIADRLGSSTHPIHIRNVDQSPTSQ